MAKGGAGGSNKSLGAIQKLLAERVQIERWLDRLKLTGDKTSESVREKVSRDYQKRLDELNEELRNYGDELEKALKQAQKTRDGLEKQEKSAQEELSEAEVRHAVGEFDETKWRQVNASHLQTLVRIREELKNANEEIAKLEEVVQGMTTAEHEAEEAARDTEAPLPPPPPTKKGAPVDELEFLKSVTEDEKHGPSAKRASGMQKGIEAEAAKPAPAPPPPPAPSPPPPPPPPKPKADLGAEGVASVGTGQGKAVTAMAKSLKCKECGTMNLPTEWYCEKCGAELSAI